MTRRFAPAFPFLALLLSAFPAAAAAPSLNVVGTWLTEDGTGRVRIEKCTPGGDTICGFAVWMKESTDEDGHPKLDTHNPDPKKRNRQILGHELIVGFKPNEDGRYEGQIYDADNGKSYDATLWARNANEVRVKGCFLSYLCGSQDWKRVVDVVPGQLPGPTGGPKGPRLDPQ